MRSTVISVCCITYNHEDYISTALDSFIVQKGDFALEIVISDDNSTDRTRDIIAAYVARYPHLIKLLTSEENLGTWRNLRKCLMAASGDFIAYCDGDDYYTSSDKLQLQLSALSQEGSCSFCFHDVILVNEEKEELGLFSKGRLTEKLKTGIVQRTDIIGAPLIAAHANSLFFRRGSLERNKKLFYMLDKQTGGDYQLLFSLCLEGNGYYIDSPMSAYRKNSRSISGSRRMTKSILREIRDTHSKLKAYSNHRFDGLVDNNYRGHCINYIEASLESSLAKRKTISALLNMARMIAVAKKSQYSFRDKLWLIRYYCRVHSK